MKKARPKSVKTNYSENANIVTETNKQNPRTLGAEGQIAKRQDGTFKGDENVPYVDCSYSFTGMCMCQNSPNCKF